MVLPDRANRLYRQDINSVYKLRCPSIVCRMLSSPLGNNASRWTRDLWSKSVMLILANQKTVKFLECFDDFFGFFGFVLVHCGGVSRGKVCGGWRWWQVTGERWQMKGDRWHVTCDMWHVKHDMWHVTHYTRHLIFLFPDFLVICASIRTRQEI